MKRICIFFAFLFSLNISAHATLSQFPAPINLSASNILYGSATLSWNSDTNGLYWIVSYNVSQSPNIIEEVVATNSININNLILGIAYNWKVRMIDNVGDTTNWSNIATFQTISDSNGCNPISRLTIDAMDQMGITVQWFADTSQTQWEVVYGELGSDPNIEGVRTTVNNYFYVIPSSNLILDHWYQIAVKNVCIGVESGWSYINTRYISNQHYDLPVQQTFENEILNSTFGFVNGTLNPWVLQNSYNSTVDGNKSVYISTNGGETNNYYALSSAISYAYIDVFVPTYATSFYLDFKWKCLGELANDGLKVYLMGENTPLDINLLPSESNRITQTFYNNANSNWQNEHIEIPAEYVGQVRRLVFAWTNNSSVGGEGGAIIDDIYITARYCATPTNPTHSYVSSSYANISWDFAQGQDNFNVQYRKIGTSQWTQINSVTSNYALQNLDDNTTYIYRVQADCSMEQSFFSSIDTFTTLIRCIPPENLHAISYSNNNAIISWNENSNVTKWIFEYGIDNGENTIYNQSIIYNRFDTLTNLTPDTYYKIRIKAISLQNDTSRYSETFRFHTLCNTISQFPFNDLADSIIWNNSIGYTNNNSCWETKGDTLLSPIFDFSGLGYPEVSFKYIHYDSVFPFLNTKLLVTNNGSSYYELINLNQTIDLVSINQEIPQFGNERYIRFAFVPRHYENSITNNQIKDFQIKELCKSPEDIAIIELTSNNVTIDWVSYTNNTSWNIVITDTISGSSTNYSVTSHPFQIPNLLPDRPYKIWIKSNCGTVTDEIWTQVIIRTNSEPNCQTPTNFYVIHSNSTKGDEIVSCYWDSMGKTIWELNYKERDAFDWNSVMVFNDPRYTIRNLNLEAEYMFRVRAVCSFEEFSDWTSIIYLNLSSLEDNIDLSSQINIYPNPSIDIINIETLNNDFGQTKLINQNGQIISKWDKLPKNIDVSKLASGTYFLQTTNQTRKITKKVIVIK